MKADINTTFAPHGNTFNIVHTTKKKCMCMDNIRTRYDYNLTIMKSPKQATDNRFKK